MDTQRLMMIPPCGKAAGIGDRTRQARCYDRAGWVVRKRFKIRSARILLFFALATSVLVLFQVILDTEHGGASLYRLGLCGNGLPANHVD